MDNEDIVSSNFKEVYCKNAKEALNKWKLHPIPLVGRTIHLMATKALESICSEIEKTPEERQPVTFSKRLSSLQQEINKSNNNTTANLKGFFLTKLS